MKEELDKISELGSKNLDRKSKIMDNIYDKLVNLQHANKTGFMPELNINDSSISLILKTNDQQISISNEFLEGLIKILNPNAYEIIIESRREIKFVFNY